MSLRAGLNLRHGLRRSVTLSGEQKEMLVCTSVLISGW
jgi:hypothetical protein